MKNVKDKVNSQLWLHSLSSLISISSQWFHETSQKMALWLTVHCAIFEEYCQKSYVSSQLFRRLPFLTLYYDRAVHIFCARVAKWRFRSKTASLIWMKSMHYLARWDCIFQINISLHTLYFVQNQIHLLHIQVLSTLLVLLKKHFTLVAVDPSFFWRLTEPLSCFRYIFWLFTVVSSPALFALLPATYHPCLLCSSGFMEIPFQVWL